MRLLSSLLLAASLVVVSSCAPPNTLRLLFAGRPAPRARTLAVAVASDLRWPVRLHDARVAIDGQLVPANTAVTADEGEHAVAVRAELRWPCSVAGSEARVSVSDVVLLDLGANGAEVQIAILARGTVFDRPEQRFTLQHRVVGHVRRPAGATSATRFDELEMTECQMPAAHEAALCRVRHRRASAERRRDVIALTCQQEKLAAIEAVLSRAAGAALDAEALERIATLDRESRRCVGESLAYVGPIVSVVRECEGEDEASPKDSKTAHPAS